MNTLAVTELSTTWGCNVQFPDCLKSLPWKITVLQYSQVGAKRAAQWLPVGPWASVQHTVTDQEEPQNHTDKKAGAARSSFPHQELQSQDKQQLDSSLLTGVSSGRQFVSVSVLMWETTSQSSVTECYSWLPVY